ncbi:hypothetical protein J8281_15040 [Aquimarina sp. U1-2]|nr:hypothetical protein [Aquimarina sp. U1-2]
MTEEFFLEPIKDLTEIDEFFMSGGSFSLPVFAPLIIEIPRDEILNIKGLRGTSNLESDDERFITELAGAAFGFRIDGVSIAVSRSKNIVTTAVQGRNYTVKEFISNGDHTITVNGVLASQGRGYPTNQVVQLRNILDSNRSLKVTNALLQRMGILELVVTDYEFPSNEGLKNIQPFSFNALSEQPLEIKKQQAEKSLKSTLENIKESSLKGLASRL